MALQTATSSEVGACQAASKVSNSTAKADPNALQISVYWGMLQVALKYGKNSSSLCNTQVNSLGGLPVG